MSSEKFESLEDEFRGLKNELKAKVENVLPKTSGESRKNAVRELLREIDIAQNTLQELEEEVRVAPNPYRMQMNARVKQYKIELNQMKQKCVRSDDNSLLSSTRRELYGNDSVHPGYSTESNFTVNRSRVIQMSDTIDRTSQSVRNAERVAAETDEVAVTVVGELGSQRESLLRTKERLIDTDSNLTLSRKILRTMHRKVITNKLILIVIIMLEIAILAGIVYYKFFKK